MLLYWILRQLQWVLFFLLWRYDSTRVMASSFLRFLDHTQRPNAVGRTPLGEWSARRRDLYLTTHNTHNRQTSMPQVGFEPTISAGERPQTYALDRAATGSGGIIILYYNIMGPPSYMRSVVDRNIVMRRMTVCSVTIRTDSLPGTLSFLRNFTPLVLVLWSKYPEQGFENVNP